MSFSNRQSVTASASMLGGLRGLSEELAKAVAALPRAQLTIVVNTTLEMVEGQYATDREVRAAIDAYRDDPRAAHSLAEGLAVRAKECDVEYIRLEEEERMEESRENFRKMCVLEGLSGLLGSPSLNHCVVDDVVYSLVQIVSDVDLFKAVLLAKVRGATGARRWGRGLALPGIRGFSHKVADIVKGLPPVKLAAVVDAALEAIENECMDDAEIRRALQAYRADPLSAIARPSSAAARSLAEALAKRADECEEEHERLEQQGWVDEARANYRKACVLAALSDLLAWPKLNHCVVDDFLYALAAGASDLKLFAATILEKVHRRLSQS